MAYEYTEIATDNSTQNIRVRFRSAAPAPTEVRIVVTSFPRTEMPSRRAGSRSVGAPSGGELRVARYLAIRRVRVSSKAGRHRRDILSSCIAISVSSRCRSTGSRTAE